MEGFNKMILNESTMIEIIQEYLNNHTSLNSKVTGFMIDRSNSLNTTFEAHLRNDKKTE